MRIGIYARVSTQRQAQANGLAQQLERLQAHALQQGWSVATEDIFRDDGYSGASLKRPGLERLRDRAAMRQLDCILITAPDRLARNYVHQVLLLGRICKLGLGGGKTGLSPVRHTMRLAEDRQISSESWTRAGPSHRSGSLQTRPRYCRRIQAAIQHGRDP